MYRITEHANMLDTMHFIVSNLIHRGGWALVDAEIAGAPAASWPLPTAGTPALVVNDFAVLAAPSPGLAACGDRFHIELTTVGAPPAGDIQITVYRKDGGATPAWDATPPTPGPVAGASSFSTTITFGASSPSKVYLYSSQSTFIVADVDVANNQIDSGSAFGYLSTAVLRDGDVSPVLGSGQDPYPVCMFDIRNNKAAGPPAFLDQLGQGKCFDSTDTAQDTRAVVQFLSNVGGQLEMHDQTITFGAGVPIHIVTKVLLTMESSTGSGTFYLRGTFPSVFITTRDVPESVIRVERNDAEYLIPAAYVAIGPL
jgi:hypothetical protein